MASRVLLVLGIVIALAGCQSEPPTCGEDVVQQPCGVASCWCRDPDGWTPQH